MNLSNIQLDNQKKILIVIIFALIVYVDTAFILKGQTSGINSLNPKITRLKSDLNYLNRDLNSMRAALAKKSLTAQKVTARSSKLILDGQLSGLLQDISGQANKFDIKIVQIRPSREQIIAKSTVIGGDKLTSILINLNLICDYHNLGRFINALENSAVFLSVQELKISTQLPEYMKQKVVLMLKTYVTK